MRAPLLVGRDGHRAVLQARQRHRMIRDVVAHALANEPHRDGARSTSSGAGSGRPAICDGSGICCAPQTREWQCASASTATEARKHGRRPTPSQIVALRPTRSSSRLRWFRDSVAVSCRSPCRIVRPRRSPCRTCTATRCATRLRPARPRPAASSWMGSGWSGATRTARLRTEAATQLLLDRAGVTAGIELTHQSDRARAQPDAHLVEVALRDLLHREVELELLDRAQHERLLTLERRRAFARRPSRASPRHLAATSGDSER